MRKPILKLAGLAGVVVLVGAATRSDARPDAATLDGVPAVALGSAALRADADDSGRVTAELRVGERVVRGTFEAAAVERWVTEADSLVAAGGAGRTAALRATNGEQIVLASTRVSGVAGLALHGASDDSLIMLHADVSRASAPAIGTLRHAAKVARAVEFVNGDR